MDNLGVAFVLAGGGGRGAYHIGVWKALREYGYSDEITAVSGTSVGALNALLYGNGEFELGEYVWNHITQKDILQFDEKTFQKAVPFAVAARICPLVMGTVPFTVAAYYTVGKMLKGGVFSPQGIEDLILKNIDMPRIRDNRMPLYAGSFAVSKAKMAYLQMNGKSDEEIRTIAMASSALPVVFPTQTIDGVTYLDGGIKDNVPVTPLYELGYRKFIVCHLSDHAKPGRFQKKFPDAQFVEIIPTVSQGGVIDGLLDFSPDGAARRIEQGYFDTFSLIQEGKLSDLARSKYDMGQLLL